MEYETTCAELLDEIARGSSTQELQERLRKWSNASEVKEQPPSKSEKKIPNDPVSIQST